MHQLLYDMAFTQTSPKLSKEAIPECTSMEEQGANLMNRCQTVCASLPSWDKLRSRARTLGHDVPRQATCSDLTALVRTGSVYKNDKVTLDEVRKLVRDAGGNPRPDRSTSGWDHSECREYLLKRKNVTELRGALPDNKKRCKMTKHDMMQVLLLDRTKY